MAEPEAKGIKIGNERRNDASQILSKGKKHTSLPELGIAVFLLLSSYYFFRSAYHDDTF